MAPSRRCACSCGGTPKTATAISEGRSAALSPSGTLVECHAGRVPAPAAEAFVIEALIAARWPPEAIDEAHAEVRRLRAAEVPGTADRERARLVTRLSKLADLYGWGDLSEAEYRRLRSEAEAAMSAIPAPDDRLVQFDQMRDVIASLPDGLVDATPEAIQTVIAELVERVETRERRVVRIVWVPAARPFFAPVEATEDGVLLAERPRTDSNRRRRP